jgi:hypothetical protein
MSSVFGGARRSTTDCYESGHSEYVVICADAGGSLPPGSTGVAVYDPIIESQIEDEEEEEKHV